MRIHVSANVSTWSARGQKLVTVAGRRRVEDGLAAGFVIDCECRLRVVVLKPIVFRRAEVSSGLHGGNDLAERREEHRRKSVGLGWNEAADVATYREVALLNSGDLGGDLCQRRAALQASEHFDCQQERRVEYDLQLLLRLDEGMETFEGVLSVWKAKDTRTHLATIGNKEAAMDVLLARK